MTAPRIDRRELDAFVDGELDLRRQLDIEAWVAEDAALRAEVARLRALRQVVREHAHYHAMPEALKRRLQGALGRPADAAPPGPRAATAPWWRWQSVGPRIAWRPAAALVLAGCALAAGTGALVWRAAEQQRRVDEVVASHVRAVLSQRLVDVASSDQHTVKPWLSSHLDFSPPVHELPGVVFVGGRVDYLDGRQVAVLVYRRRAHVIDVFIEPSSGPAQAPRLTSERGFHVLEQVREGMRSRIVSDLNVEELRAFAGTLAAADAPR